MPKLKLDLFSPATESENQSTEEPVNADTPTDKAVPVVRAEPTPASRKINSSQSPKFVPVGFHSKHLQILDEAVLRLRRKNEWQASKSGLIRCMIEHHERDLDTLWIAKRRGESLAAPIGPPQ